MVTKLVHATDNHSESEKVHLMEPNLDNPIKRRSDESENVKLRPGVKYETKITYLPFYDGL
jgi:hypothetical protein